MKFKINITKTSEINFSVKALVVIVVSFLFYLLVNYFYLHLISFNQIRISLKDTVSRVESDQIFENNHWDTTGYVNDEQMPPSSGPLYIITSDGFVIERYNQINGFLDTSRFEYASSFTTPQTITTPANELWRLYSKPISKNNVMVGVVIIGYYQPDPEAIQDVDKQLLTAANQIVSDITVDSNNQINVQKVDARSISIFLSYEIVDQFNKRLEGSGPPPGYIDRVDGGYLTNFPSGKIRTIKDSKTGELFQVYMKPITDSSGKIAGYIAAASSLKQVNQILRYQLIFSAVAGFDIALLTFILLIYLLRHELAGMAEEIKLRLQRGLSLPGGKSGLVFDPDKSIVRLGDKLLKVPYASTQYEICKVLFSNPKKRWELDEITDKMGEEYSDEAPKKVWRKFYDAVRLLNEKSKQDLGANIIIPESGTFRVNTQIQPQNS
jgi:hypothetical protein